jgi:WD40 repeat protein
MRTAREKQQLRVRCRRCRTSFMLRPEEVCEAARRPDNGKWPLWSKMAGLFTITLRGPDDMGGSDLVPAGERGTSAVPPTGQAAVQQTTDYVEEGPAARTAPPLPDWIEDIPDAPKRAAPTGEQAGARNLPARISRFEVRAYVGGGAFGTVYRAHDPHLERPVALKVPRPGTVETPQHLKRFLDEARAAAQLRHPHIVPIYEVGSDNDRPYIAFAFIEGRTLAQARDEGRLELRRAVAIIRDLAEALAYAHGLGIIHRDVKPANVLLDKDDASHLTDFGLACRYEPATEEGMRGQPEASRGISGTPVYMSPEHWSGLSGAVRPASDQYSLGVMLYELLCGYPPFEGPLRLLKFNHESRPPDAPRSSDPTLPRDLEAICLKTLAKRPEERYAGCQELADDLRRWMEGEPVKARRMGLRERLIGWCRREPALAAALGFALAVLLAFGLMMFRHATTMEEAKKRADENADRADENAAIADDNAAEARQHEKEAKDNEQMAQQNLASSLIDQALNLCERGEVGQGLVRLADARRVALKANADDLVRVIDFNLGGWRPQLHALTALLPHHDKVTASVYSPDGRIVATASGSQVFLWDAVTGASLPQSLPPREPVLALAFGGPKEAPLLLVAGEKNVRLWDLKKTEDPIASYNIRDNEPIRIRTASVSPDGKAVLMGGGTEGRDDGWARLWTPGREQRDTIALDGLNDPVYVAAFSRDGSQCVTGSGSRFGGEARLWDTHSGRALGPALKHKRAVSAATFSPDGTQVLTGTRGLFEGEAQLWDVASGQRKGAPLLSALEIFAVAFSPDGTQAAIGGQDRAVRLWDLRGSQPMPLGSPMRHAMDINSVAFSPDGRALLTGSDDGTARLWQLSTGLAPALSCGHLGPVLAAAYNPNPKRPLFCTGAAHVSLTRNGLVGLSGQARLWDLETGESVDQLAHPMPVSALAWHPNGQLLLTGCWDGRVRLWEVQRERPGEQIAVFDPGPEDDWVQALAFSPDGKRFAAAWRNGWVQMVELGDAGNRKLWKRQLHEKRLYALAFSPDGQRIATGSLDTTIQFWSAKTGEAIPGVKMMKHPDAVLSVVYSPDGRHILSGYAGGALLWQTDSGEQIRAPFQHQVGVFGVAFGPGPLILTGGTDRLARLWDLETGKPLGPAFPHGGALMAATFDPRGAAVLTAGLDACGRLWPVPAPVKARQEQVARWAEVISGIELGEDDVIGMLDPTDWEKRRQRLKEAGGPPAIEEVLYREVAARPQPVVPESVPNPHTMPPVARPAPRPARKLPVIALIEIDVSLLRNPPVAQPPLHSFRELWLDPFVAGHPLLKEIDGPLLQRIQRITFVANGTKEKPEITLFLRGEFDAPSLHRVLDLHVKEHPQDLRIEKDDGRPIYVFRLGEQEALAAFTADEHTLVLASSRDALRAALDAGEDGVVLAHNNVTLPRHRLAREKGEALWLAVLLTDEMKGEFKRLGGVPEEISPRLRAVTATLDLREVGAGVDVRIHTEDRKTAWQVKGFLEDVFKEFEQWAKLPADGLKKKIEVENNDIVHLRLFFNRDALKQLFPAKE